MTILLRIRSVAFHALRILFLLVLSPLLLVVVLCAWSGKFGERLEEHLSDLIRNTRLLLQPDAWDEVKEIQRLRIEFESKARYWESEAKWMSELLQRHNIDPFEPREL